MRFKEVKKIIAEQAIQEQDLLEVNMSPGNLAKLANQIDARAGMEFEMIVPDAEGSDDDGDMEQDFDQDEGVSDIDDACNFFYDGDYNSRRDIQRLRESMQEDYSNWVYEKIDNDWHNDGFEFFKEYLDREEPFDPEDYQERAEDEIKAEFPEMDPDSEDFGELVAEKLREINAQYYVDQWEEQGRNYDYAREEFESEKQDDYDQGDWLNDAGYGTMSDISGNYDIQWPHWTSVGNGGREIEDIADSFSRAIDRPVNSSKSYHGARREEGHYVVEPDGSLTGDNSGDTGLEFVSPPLPLSELLSDLKKVKKWADSEGCYTGADNGTGLHINVSVPGLGKNQENLDYVKLALLLGDEHVLKEFERLGNTYCKSGLEIVKKNIKDRPEEAKALLDKMKSNLEQLASRSIHNAITNKFTSINSKDGYIEFRSPGGDWLNDKFDKIEPTLMRFVVALDAAVKPDLYRQEYLKKLYKALAPAGDKNTIEYFAKYVAGEMPKLALKSFVRQAQLQRSIERDPNKGKGKWWWNVAIDGQRVEVVANDSFGAWQAAIDTNPEWMRFNRANADIKPLRPYEEKPAQPTQSGGGLYKIYDTRGTLIAGDEYGSDRAALARAGVWAMQRGVDVVVKNAQGQEIGRVSAFGDITPAAQQPAASTRRWEIVNNATGDVVQVFTGGTEDNAADYALNNYGHRFTYTTRPWDGEVQRAGNQIPNYYIKSRDTDEIVKGYFADDSSAAHEYLTQWKRDNNLADADYVYGRVSALPDAVQRNIVGNQPAATGPAQNQEGNWGIWIDANNRFANQPGEYARGETPPLIRFPTRAEAEKWIEQQRAERPNMRSDIEVREIAPRLLTGSTLDLQRQRASASGVNNLTPRGPGPWEVASRENNQVYYNTGHGNRNAAETEARTWLTQNGHNPEDFEVRTRQTAQAPQTLTRPGQGQQVFTGNWKVMIDGEEVYQFGGIGNSQADANRVGRDWILQQIRSGTLNPVSGADVEILPVMG